MTPAQFADQLTLIANELRTNNRPLKLAASTTHAAMSNRIFTLGRGSDNGSIGSYSSKDIWINPTKTATRNKKGFNPNKGKAGNAKFKSDPAKVRKTSYFEGWKGFRETQGLKTGVVNLNNTGDMFSDFNRPVQIVNINEYVSSFSRPLNAKKAEGNQDHFDKVIFKLTTDEKALFFKTANFELKKLLQ